MAAASAAADPLLCLRQSIASNTAPLSTKSDDPSSGADVEPNLAKATHLHFVLSSNRIVLPLDTPTRFESAGKPIDLRSIYFAWLNKDVAIPEYIASARRLNEELETLHTDAATPIQVQNLVFTEKLDLITWLEGASDESEYIKPLDAEAAAAQAAVAADVAAGSAGGISAVPSGTFTASAATTRPGKVIDPRLREIYQGERKMGDRNSVLRGIKHTDFSHIHKYSAAFTGKSKGRPGTVATAAAATAGGARVPGTNGVNGALPSGQNQILVSSRPKHSRRPEPIILLSPSASSLLRMSNIKSFLDNGVYQPADSASNNANILHISRLLPSIDPQRPLRFILVDTPDQFKPDYWSRVVAVFTTGQTWQFKSYKWQSPPDLFSHALGIYVGWRGEETPATVKGWGRGVISRHIDKHHAHQGPQGRWRDREVVEGIWTAIEESMRSKGWGKDTGATGGR